MTPAEAMQLFGIARAACPQQASDEYTPDAWAMILQPYRFEDAQQALIEHCRTHAFVAPAEIIAGVKRIRAKRIDAYGHIDVPSGLEEAEYRAYLRDKRRAIGDGRLTRTPPPELPTRDMRLLEGTFQEVTR